VHTDVQFKFFEGMVDIKTNLQNGIFFSYLISSGGGKMGMVLQLEELKTLEPGLILAEPVLNQFGQTLLAQGVELQARHLKVLKTWGCKAVKVMDDGSSEKEPEVSPEIMDRALARVNWRLNWEPTTSLEKEIFQLAVKRVIQKFLRP
jgi:hypothetical protein